MTRSLGLGRPAGDGEHRMRFVVQETPAKHGREPSFDELHEAMVSVWGRDFGLRNATWITRFNNAARQATRYRQGRVLLAGDAAHVHAPMGGQGLNLGVQDAVNLGWKLARVAQGTAPDALLDTYFAERHPVGAAVLQGTLVQSVLTSSSPQTAAVTDLLGTLLGMDEPRRAMAARQAALDVHYDLGEGHPLLGRRMPDLDLLVDGRPVRVYTLLHDARPLLLSFGGGPGFDLTPWGDRVRHVDAACDGDWELPVIGAVRAPGSVLVRPDGHVAWTGEPDDPRLPLALMAWFGAGQPA